MKNLFSFDMVNLKYINLSKLSIDNAKFYHYYFNYNKGTFIEAPFVCSASTLSEKSYKTELSNSHIYLASYSTNFYLSTDNLFNLVHKNNLIHKSIFLTLFFLI